ncbi:MULTISPECIES: cellulase N-terminal Ig-like domain-containing protein [unclassified Flavobacterium]|uniref:cellulase N-terminal Ig-like domain-containing protein n=1 Tax=unclassified Flavobacterium TaxID=196869 RepID=UPI00190EBAAA|nr:MULTISPECIES: cellulase N-terminal Ig-like domain-containing protein [unclassified Flavobacterium]
MLKLRQQFRYLIIVLFLSVMAYSKPIIYVNQVGFDPKSPKIAIIAYPTNLRENASFDVVDTQTHKIVFTALIGKPQNVDDWKLGEKFYKADFSSFQKPGTYKITFKIADQIYTSQVFLLKKIYWQNELFHP